MNRKTSPLLVVFMLFLVFVPQAGLFKPKPLVVEAQSDLMAHWYEDAWTDDRTIFNIYNETFARSINIECWYDPKTRTYTQIFGVGQYVEDDTGWFVPYIYTRDEAKKCYRVQTGLVGAEIYQDHAVIYDPTMTEIRVKSEKWFLAYGKDFGETVQLKAKKFPDAFDVIENSTGVYISVSGTIDKPKGSFVITYCFHIGSGLKHFVEWNTEEECSIQVKQEHLLDFDKVKTAEGNVTSSVNVKSAYYLFQYGGNDYWVMENQWAMVYYPNGTLRENQCLQVGDINFAGKKVTYVFGSWSLASGESLVVDPDTTTLSPPSKDTYVFQNEPANNFGSETAFYVSTFLSAGHHYNRRPLVGFDISSIPSSVTINSAELRLYCSNSESGRTYEFRRITGAWTELGVTWNNQPAVTATHGVDYSSPSSTGWYNNAVTDIVQDARNAGTTCGIRLKDATEDSYTGKIAHFSSKEYDGSDPQLYVDYTVLNNAPTITSASISDRDDTDNCYAMKKYYSFVAVVNDADGATDIAKVYLRGKNGATVLWEVRTDSLTGTASWSIYSGATIIDLDTGSCTFGESGNVGTATFKVRLEWDHNNLADLEIAVYVEDSAGASAGWTDKRTDYWDAINRLVTTSFSASDTRINKGTSATLSGNVRYATTVSGNTASSSYPPDAQFTAVHIHDSSHTSKGSDTSIVNGAFSVSFNIPDAVQSNTYHVYLDMAGDYSDADAPDGDTVSVIGDQIKVTFSANTTSLLRGKTVGFTVGLTYDYDETSVTDYSYNINRNGTGFGNPHTTGTFTDTSATPTVYVYDFTSVTDNTYGITVFIDPNDITVTWTAPFSLSIKACEWDNSTTLAGATVDMKNSSGTFSQQVNSTGWAEFKGITDSSVSWWVRWQNTTYSHCTVNYTASQPISADTIRQARCKVWSLMVNAKDYDLNLLSSSSVEIHFTFPNGTSKSWSSMNTITFKVMNGTGWLWIKWQNNWVYGNQSHTLTDGTNPTTINAQCKVDHISWAFKDDAGSWTLYPTPTSIVLQCPNNTRKTLSSYSNILLQNGTYYVRDIDWQNNNIVPSTNPNYTFAGQGDYTWTINCRVYEITMSFKDDTGSWTLYPTPTQVKFTAPNSTLCTISSYTPYLQNGTNTIKQILWQDDNIKQATNPTFNAESGNPSFNCQVYEIDFSNSFKDSAGTSLPTTPSAFTLTFPNSTTSGSLSTSSYLIQNGTTTWASITWQATNVVPASATFDATDGDPTVNCLIYNITSFTWKDHDGSNTLPSNPSAFTVQFCNGTSKDFTSESSLSFVQTGTHYITAITWQSSDVQPSPNPSLSLTANSGWTINCAVYSITSFTWKNHDGAETLYTAPTQIKIQYNNGTEKTYSSFSSISWVQKGTHTLTYVLWQGIDVILGSPTITMDADKSWTVNCAVYSLDYIFKSNDGTWTLDPTPVSCYFACPNGTYVNATSFSFSQIQKGTYTVKQIKWLGLYNVKPATDPSQSITSDTTWTINCRVYTVTFDKSPSQGNMTIDGSSLAVPQTMHWANDTVHTFNVTAVEDANIFSQWSDGSTSLDRVITVTQDTSYTAYYTVVAGSILVLTDVKIMVYENGTDRFVDNAEITIKNNRFLVGIENTGMAGFIQIPMALYNYTVTIEKEGYETTTATLDLTKAIAGHLVTKAYYINKIPPQPTLLETLASNIFTVPFAISATAASTTTFLLFRKEFTKIIIILTVIGVFSTVFIMTYLMALLVI